MTPAAEPAVPRAGALVLRGGTVVDGTGRREPSVADVVVRDGRVVAIGPHAADDAGPGATELDCADLVVAPGFVDLHTHYDPQVLWDPWLTPSDAHGVTSVVAGNCGFSLAPCPPEGRERVLRTLAAVEDMSLDTLRAGARWDGTSYGDYLGHIARRGMGINFGGYVGHTAVRLAVLGDDAFEREATPAELDAMRALVAAALEGGALGVSTDRSHAHRAHDGRRVPSTLASQHETETLLGVTAALGRGVVHVQAGEDFAWLYDLQPKLGRPVTFTAFLTYPPDTASRAHWRDKLAVHRDGRARGADVHPQVTCRPVTARIVLTNPAVFAMVPAFGELIGCPIERQREAYGDRVWRQRAWAELAGGTHVNPRWDAFVVAASPTAPRAVGRSLHQLAIDHNRNPLDLLCDLALADELATEFQVTYANDDEVGVRALLSAEGTVLGLSDAGAHATQLCDACLPTDFLAHWVRDRNLCSLAAGVHRLTGEPAAMLGLRDRGTIAVGNWADIAVLDWAALDPGPLRTATDLPAAGRRLLADRPSGVEHVVVNGVLTRRDGARVEGAVLPGALLDNAAA